MILEDLEESNLISIKKVTAVFKCLVELVIMTFLYALLDNVGGVKKYIVVMFLCGVYLLLGKKKRWPGEAILCVVIPVVTYIIIGSLSALIHVNLQSDTLKIILYWITPLVFSFALYSYYGENMEYIINIQFLGACLAYAFFDVPFLMKLFQWESIYAFVFGIFAIYYAYRKKWIGSFVAIMFVFFAEKRIALLSLLIALMFMGIVWIFQENKKLVLFFWGLIIAMVYLYLYLIYSGTMYDICWGANINTNGRVEMYGRMANEFQFSIGYLGRGLGVVENLLEHWNISTYSNLHNDLLKFYIELGFLGLLIFLLSYGIMFWLVDFWFGKSSMCFLFGIVVYTMALFATDNVSIYLIYLIPFYSAIFTVLSLNRRIMRNSEDINDKNITG